MTIEMGELYPVSSLLSVLVSFSVLESYIRGHGINKKGEERRGEEKRGEEKRK
jgi:hypothetical protein